MKVNAIIKAVGEILRAAKNFLGKLLKEGIVNYLLVPEEISHGRTLT